MASRKEAKERLRQQRQAREQAEREQARRKRVYGYAVGGVLIIASTLAVAVVVATGGGTDGSGSGGAGSLSSTNFDGLVERREAARVPTMAEASTVGAAHFHPVLKVYVNGKQVKIPVNIGIDPGAAPSDMAGLHTHDDSGTIHNEAGTEARLSQFFAVWGVPFTSKRLGPHRATRKKKVKMWVEGKPSREFGKLQLEDGQQIVVAYGTNADEPF
jgi:hypothetical protein